MREEAWWENASIRFAPPSEDQRALMLQWRQRDTAAFDAVGAELRRRIAGRTVAAVVADADTDEEVRAAAEFGLMALRLSHHGATANGAELFELAYRGRLSLVFSVARDGGGRMEGLCASDEAGDLLDRLAASGE